MMSKTEFLIPRDRIEFLNLVKRVAREDVNKCIAGVHATHPQLFEHIRRLKSNQHDFGKVNSSDDRQVNNMENLTHVPTIEKPRPSLSCRRDIEIKNRVKSSELTEEKALDNHSSLPKSSTPRSSDVPTTHRAKERALQAFNRHVSRRSPKESPTEKEDKQEEKRRVKSLVSDHLLKPTFSIAQKHTRREDDFTPPIDNNFKLMRKEQRRATSLLLRTAAPKMRSLRAVVRAPEISNRHETIEAGTPREQFSEGESRYHDKDNYSLSARVFRIENPHEVKEEDVFGKLAASQQTSPITAEEMSTQTGSSGPASPTPDLKPVRIEVIPRPKPKKRKERGKGEQRVNTSPQSNILELGVSTDRPNEKKQSKNLFDQLENGLLDDVLRSIAREELNDKMKFHDLLQQKIDLTCKTKKNEDQLDEIIGLLDTIEQQEQEIRDRLNEGYQKRMTTPTEPEDTHSEEESKNVEVSMGRIYSRDKDIKGLIQNRNQYLEYKKWARYSSDIAPEAMADILSDHIFNDIYEEVSQELDQIANDLPDHLMESEFVLRMSATSSELS